MIRFFRHYVPLNLLLVPFEAFIRGGAVYVGIGAALQGVGAHEGLSPNP